MSREYFWTHLVALPHAFVCVKKWLLGGRFPSCLPRFAVIPSFEVAIICLAVYYCPMNSSTFCFASLIFLSCCWNSLDIMSIPLWKVENNTPNNSGLGICSNLPRYLQHVYQMPELNTSWRCGNTHPKPTRKYGWKKFWCIPSRELTDISAKGKWFQSSTQSAGW